MEMVGFWMLALVVVMLITSGLPAFSLLIGVSVLFAGLGLITGTLPYMLLAALPGDPRGEPLSPICCSWAYAASCWTRSRSSW
jgi:hypothetical protein